MTRLADNLNSTTTKGDAIVRKFAAIVTMIVTMFTLSAVSAGPANAAPAKPTVTQVSNKKPLPAGGQNVTLRGTNLNVVTTVFVDNLSAQVVTKSSTSLVFITPPHAEGLVSITLIHPGGSYVFKDSMLYKKGPSRALVPLPFIPETLKVKRSFSMQPGSKDWVIKITNGTPKVCRVSGLLVTGLRKGECSLSFEITVDSMDPTYRSRQALYFVTIN
jgi:hypothetical protein